MDKINIFDLKKELVKIEYDLALTTKEWPSTTSL